VTSKLSTLKQGFNQLLSTEQLNLILSIRASRRVSKRQTIVRVAKPRAASKKQPPSPETLLRMLTPELAAQLLAELGET